MQPTVVPPMPGGKPITFVLEGSGDLPALYFSEGSILTKWKLSPEERAAIALGADVQLWIWGPLYPHDVRVDNVNYGDEEL